MILYILATGRDETRAVNRIQTDRLLKNEKYGPIFRPVLIRQDEPDTPQYKYI